MGAPVRLPAVWHLHVTPPPGFSEESREPGNKEGEAVWTVWIRAGQNQSFSNSESYSASVWKLVGQGHEHVIICLSHLLPQTEFHKTWKPDAGPH